MNRVYFLCCLALFIAFTQKSIAQTNYVTIPDPNFRAALKALYPGCFNAQDQMDGNCTAIVSATTLNVSSKNINDLTGIEYFMNLETLQCGGNNLTDLPPIYERLERLECQYNKFTTLPPLPKYVDIINFADNELVSITSLSSNNSLLTVDFSNNNLTALPVLPDGLVTLNISDNNISELPPLPSNLRNLYCGNNQLTSLPGLPSNLSELYCYNNQITSLPSLPSNLRTLDAGNNPLTSVSLLPPLLEDLYVYNTEIIDLPAIPASVIRANLSQNRLSFNDFDAVIKENLFSFSGYFQKYDINQNVILLNIGDDFSINGATAGPNNLYQWKKLGYGISPCYDSHFPNIPNETSSIFSRTNAQASDAGRYYCQVTSSLPQYDGTCYTKISLLSNEVLVKFRQTLTFEPIPDKIYGDPDFILAATASSGLPVTVTSSNPSVAIIDGGYVKIVGVGSTVITASQSGDDAFVAAETIQRTLNVNLYNLTITAHNQSKVYGEENPVFTYSYSGFVNGDNESVVVTPPTVTTNASTNSNVGNYTIVPSGAVVPNYSITYETAELSVTPASLTAIANDAILEYGSPASALTISYVGLRGDDTSADIDVAPLISTAVQGSDVGTYQILLSGGSDNNYIINDYIPGTLTIVPALLQVSATATKIYGDLNPDVILQYSGFKGNDSSFDIDNPPSATSAVTTSSNVGVYDITISGGNDDNYIFQYLTGKFTVNKSTLTATTIPISRFYGDPNPLFNIIYSGFKGNDNSSVISLPPTGTTNATQTTPVGDYPVILSGGEASNYVFNFTNGVLSITKAPLIITAANAFKTYGEINPAFTLTYSGFKLGENFSVLNVLPSTATSASETSDVGSYSITLSGGSDDNYSYTLVNGSLSVVKALLTISASDQTRVYGEVNPVLTYTITGFKASDDQSVIDGLPVIYTSATVDTPVGQYPINVNSAIDNNYSFSYVSGTLNVTKANLTVSVNNASKYYGDINPVFTVAYSGFKNGDTESLIIIHPSISTTASQTSNVGSYNLIASGASANNYNFNYVDGSLSIVPAILTVTASNATKVYGQANPPLSFTYSGFKLSENVNVLNIAPTVFTTADINSSTGSYPIVVSGGVDDNYEFNYVTGYLLITKGTITIRVNDVTRIYGENNPEFAFSYSGFTGWDDETSIDVLPSATTIANISSNVGNYPITISGGFDDNYTFEFVSGTLTIAKAMLTATADDLTRYYGSSNPVFTISYTGFKLLDNPNMLDSPPMTNTNASITSEPGTYPIYITGGVDKNYSFTNISGTLTIEKAILTITADPKSRVYISDAPVLTYTLSGFVLGQNETELNSLPTISTSATLFSNAGNYPIYLSGGFDDRYQYNLIDGIFTIYKAEQTIYFPALNPVNYGDPSFVIFVKGGASGNQVTFTSSNPSVVSVFGNVATIVGVGTAVITASQSGDINYNAAPSVIQSLVVNKGSQFITFNSLPIKKFGDANFYPGASASSGLQISYESSDPQVASIANDGSIIINGVGTATIIASQVGNERYHSANQISQTLEVLPSDLKVTPSSTTICLGSMVTMTASGAASYTWSPSSGLSILNPTTVIARPNKTTTYVVTGHYNNGNIAISSVTVKVNGSPLAAGANHSIVKFCENCGGESKVKGTGYNSYGQLGDNTLTQRTSLVDVLINDQIVEVAAGASHSLFLKNDGTVWGTGLNTNGQLGDGSTVNKRMPVQVLGLSNITAISSGLYHSVFLKNDGTVYVCGLNADGQLGDGSLNQSSTPIEIPGLPPIKKISAGGYHTLFLSYDGNVYATGRNTYGQLANGTTTGSSMPLLISSLSNIEEISAGALHSLFLQNDGMVYVAGYNGNGQLGNGSTAMRTTASALASIKDVTTISAGSNHSLFITRDGKAWATGLNSNGQLGNGTLTSSTVPVMISSLSNVIMADAGATHSLFLTDNGIVWGAGRNANGQLGDGTTTTRAFPIQIIDVIPCGRSDFEPDPNTTVLENFEWISAYPIPADKELTIDLPRGSFDSPTTIRLIDHYGHIVRSYVFEFNEATKTLFVEDLPAGVFLLQVQNNKTVKVKKILIQHK